MADIWATFLIWLHALQDVLSQSDLVYLGALVGLLVALFPFYKRIGIFVYKSYLEPVGKFFSTFATLPDRLQSLEKSVDKKINDLYDFHVADVAEIKKELTPNGGHSMKDTVNQLAVGMTKIVAGLETMTMQGNRMEERQKNILNSVTIPTFETDDHGACTYGNKAYLDLIGRSLEEIKGPSWINVIHPDDRAHVQSEWAEAVNQKRNFELTYRLICREKLVYEVSCVATPIAGNGYIGKFEAVTPLGTYQQNP